MGRFFRYGVLLWILCTGCEKGTLFPDTKDPSGSRITDGFCIRFGDSITITHEEIDYYDASTHMIYLKESHAFLAVTDWRLLEWSFKVFARKETIYRGTLYPAWSSTLPIGAYIDFPFRYPDNVIRIGHSSERYVSFGNDDPDPREDETIVSTLKEYGQYHEGLAVSVGEVLYDLPGELTFSFTVTNDDSYHYHILSPEKMGTGLFHYFTNGLIIYNENGDWFNHQSEVEWPDPWDSWSMDWMELLESGTSRTFQVHYPYFDAIPPGQYHVSFSYPGLSNVGLDAMGLIDGRIWLGDISAHDQRSIAITSTSSQAVHR